jgi:hypothetical protein
LRRATAAKGWNSIVRHDRFGIIVSADFRDAEERAEGCQIAGNDAEAGFDG